MVHEWPAGPPPATNPVHEESWHAPYSVCIHYYSSSALTSVDGTENKRVLQASPIGGRHRHASLPALGWKTKASHPSKPCRTTSALVARAYATNDQAGSTLHTMTVLQVHQARLLRVLDESGLDSAAFKELCRVTDLALNTTKSGAQAIGRALASLMVLEHHL